MDEKKPRRHPRMPAGARGDGRIHRRTSDGAQNTPKVDAAPPPKAEAAAAPAPPPRKAPTPPGADAPAWRDPLESLDTSREEAVFSSHKRSRLVVAIAFPLCAVVLVFSLFQIWRITSERRAAQDEYDQIASIAFGGTSSRPTAGTSTADSESEVVEEEPMGLAEVVALNSDCVGWIEMPGTPVNYPVVRGTDNDKYLNRTFLGNQNAAGAIFMDYRNALDFSARHTLIYGHNLKNGNMFGSLHKYIDESYRQNNPYIYLYTPGGVCHRYVVFNCRVTDMYDASYQVDFASDDELLAFAQSYGAPAGTNVSRMLTLSTCTNNADEERLLVHAYYDGTVQRSTPEA